MREPNVYLESEALKWFRATNIEAETRGVVSMSSKTKWLHAEVIRGAHGFFWGKK